MSPSLVGVLGVDVPVPDECPHPQHVVLSPLGVPRLDVPIPGVCPQGVSSPQLPAPRGGAGPALGGAAAVFSPSWRPVAGRERRRRGAGPGRHPALVPGGRLFLVVAYSRWSLVLGGRRAPDRRGESSGSESPAVRAGGGGR